MAGCRREDRAAPGRAGSRAAGPQPTALASDRARLVQALARDCHRALDSFDAAGESARLGDAARTAAWATLGLAGAALLVLGLGLARAATPGAALPWIGGALALGAVALLPLGTLRTSERRRFATAASGLRQRFVAALRSGFERELEASQKRVQDAIAPFGRHVRAESERVRGQAHEVGSRRKDVDALRAQVTALR